jgi:hypothetical protein
MADLEKARGSTYKPFPPKNRWYAFDFARKRQPSATEVRQALAEQVEPMLNPPIRNIGVKGIRKAAQMVPKWPDTMGAGELRAALFNAHIFISAVGGTGGGCFRYMFSRFLHEAAEIAADPRLEESAAAFQHIGDQWEALGEWFRETSEAHDAALLLGDCEAHLNALADLEEAAWTQLREPA